MMRTARDVEAYLGALGRPCEAVDAQPGTYLLTAKTGATIAIRVEAPIVLARVVIAKLEGSQGQNVALLRNLLEHNASALMHTAFGLEGELVVLSAALVLENLDFNELEAVVDEIELALAREVPTLHELNRKGF
jgi:Tir chaperone protein (CesT) family